MASYDLFTNVDCDGILDHACSTTINSNRWLVLSSEGCPKTISECPQAFKSGNFFGTFLRLPDLHFLEGVHGSSSNHFSFPLSRKGFN